MPPDNETGRCTRLPAVAPWPRLESDRERGHNRRVRAGKHTVWSAMCALSCAAQLRAGPPEITEPTTQPAAAAPITKSEKATPESLACDAGDAESCWRLAILKLNARGASADDRLLGLRALERSCSLGFPRGCADWGDTMTDRREAVRLYQLACEKLEPVGCESLAFAYDRGDGVTRDAQRAAAAFAETCRLDPSMCD